MAKKTTSVSTKRMKRKGYTLVTPFQLKNDWREMITRYQEREINKGNPKPTLGEGINHFLKIASEHI